MIYIVLVYFILLILIARKRSYSAVSIYLIGVYFISLLSSLFLFSSNPDKYQISILPSLIYCICLTLFFSPFFKLTKEIDLNLPLQLKKRVILIGYIISFITLVACIAIYPLVLKINTFGFAEARIMAVKGDSLLQVTRGTLPAYGIAILRWFSHFSYALIIFFFVVYTSITGNKLLKSMLFLSSLSASWFGILSAGRTQLIYWLLYFIFVFILFKPILTNEKLKKIKNVMLGLICLVLSYLIAVTADRFGNSSSGFQDSLIEYAGQSYLNFCLFFDNFNYDHFSLQRIMPLFTSFFNPQFSLSDYKEHIAAITGMDIGIFYTLLGDLYVDVGIFGMISYSIIYNIISSKYIRSQKKMNFSSLITIGILYQIPLHGVFYYSLWRFESSVCIVILFIFILFLKKYKK